MIGKESKKKHNKYRNRFCKRCREYYLSTNRFGKICYSCKKRPSDIPKGATSPKNSLFSQIKVSMERKEANSYKYMIVDSKGKEIEKFRTLAAAKYHLNYIKGNYYDEKLNITEFKRGVKQ